MHRPATAHAPASITSSTMGCHDCGDVFAGNATRCLFSRSAALPMSCSPHVSSLVAASRTAHWHARTLPAHHAVRPERLVLEDAEGRVVPMGGRVASVPSPMSEREQIVFADLSGLAWPASSGGAGFYALRDGSAPSAAPLACVEVVAQDMVQDSLLLVVLESARSMKKERAHSVRIARSLSDALHHLYEPSARPLAPMSGAWTQSWMTVHRVSSHVVTSCDRHGPALRDALGFSQLSSVEPCVASSSPGGVTAVERRLDPSPWRGGDGSPAPACSPLDGVRSTGNESGAWTFNRGEWTWTVTECARPRLPQSEVKAALQRSRVFV